MSRVTKASRRSKALPTLGAAGLSLTLASGVSVATNEPAPDTSARNASVNQKITLYEDEFFDVSLATFHVFDKESQNGKQLACGCGGGCCLFARAPSTTFGSDAYSPPPPRPSGRGHKHIPK
jgi:hypothetical protein